MTDNFLVFYIRALDCIMRDTLYLYIPGKRKIIIERIARTYHRERASAGTQNATFLSRSVNLIIVIIAFAALRNEVTSSTLYLRTRVDVMSSFASREHTRTYARRL